jgi:hypothetical protein
LVLFNTAAAIIASQASSSGKDGSAVDLDALIQALTNKSPSTSTSDTPSGEDPIQGKQTLLDSTAICQP